MSVYVDYNARGRKQQEEAASKKQPATAPALAQPALAMLAAAAAAGSASSAGPAAARSSSSNVALSASARPFNPDDLGPSVYRPPSQQLYNQKPQPQPQPQPQPAHPAPAAAAAAPVSAAASDMQAYLRAQHLALHGPPQAAAPMLQPQKPYSQLQSQSQQQQQQQSASSQRGNNNPPRPSQRIQQRAPQAAQPPQSQPPHQQQSQQQSRPPRGQQQQQQSASQPSNQSAQPQRGISASVSADAASSSQRGRGGRNNRGGGRMQAAPASASSSSSSSAAPASAASAASLPSRVIVRDQAWREGHADNSMLAKAITEQLQTNSYDCSICSEPVGRNTKIWSCDQCHIILHLKCIKKWFETNRAQSLGDTSFRCPGCMFVRVEPPGDYVCFCGKQVEPDPSPFLTPHACSSPCGKPRNCGVHACNLPCHPGFCPKCTIPGPMTTCACGATERATKCGEEFAEKATCDGVCGKPLSCGVQTHTCERKCHNGPCDPCADTQQLQCFCGQVDQARVCGQPGTVVDPQHPERKSFSCARICNRLLDCGEHRCKSVCHAGPCDACVRQPPSADAQLQKCACGKVAHTKAEISAAGSKLAGWARASCKDTLPTCGAKCGRLLNCNWHLCSLPCHDFDTTPCGMQAPAAASSSSSSSSRVQPPSVGCSEVVKRQCRCVAQNIVEVPCTQIRGDSIKGIPPASQLDVRCDVKCRVKLACKKHQCGQICCPRGESHVCVKLCGKPLGCGKHNCDAFCHIGSCQPCGVVYRDGITCQCGRTSTGRNTKCGTVLPHCPHPCTRQRACDPSHHCIQTCHENACAPCVVLTSKMCAGGHKMLQSIPCYASPSCGVTCNRILRCGIHACKKPCHAGKCTVALGSQMGERKGWAISPAAAPAERKDDDAAAEEEDDGSIRSCLQKCGQKRSDCGHPCGAKCHPGEECPTDAPCKESVRIYCDCKRISKVVPCSVEGGGIGLRALSCTSQCEVETRNARFRDALQLDDSVPRIPYPSELLDEVISADLFEFVLRMERMLAEFLALTSGSSKTFTAMPTAQRWVLHQLASYYNLDSESFDPEPRRAVRVIKTALSSSPKMKLSDAVKLYREAKAGKGGLTTAKVTLAPSTVIHLFDLDQEPRIAPSDLNLALRPYSLDYSGERNNNFRVNFLDHSHALIVFTDAQLAANVRANLITRKLFNAEPDESASAKAAAAWRTNYQHNGLFRRHHETGGVSSLKKLTAAAPSSAASAASSFDDWSSARSKAAEPAAAPAAAAASSWDSSSHHTSDHASDAEFEAVLERSRLEALASASSSSSAATAAPSSAATVAPSSAASASASSSVSSSTAGSVSFSQPKVVSTTNKFVALHGEDDDDEDDDEADAEGEGEAGKTTRKQRRRAAAAAAASAGSGAGDSASPDAWEELASKKSPLHDAPVAFAAKSAFDD